ncbi:MAG TPA: hypothetical protein VG387_10045 [Rhizomicrobium sp.]|jgi:hypothetical protein|nr:hypothetical protein [Rhizomicrobium sp.]
MFIGHYGVSFAAKAADKRLPLWLLFLAVQWLDVVWSGLVMLDVEKMRIVPGFTQSNGMDLYYMPYTHGLIGALALAAAMGAVVAAFVRDRKTTAFAVVAGAVFSHWLLDLVVHVEDLPLWGNGFKVGFGLWRHVWISFPLEIATLVAGAAIYARAVPSRTRNGDRWLWAAVAAMSAVQVYGTFGPDPATPVAEAQTALFAYIVLAGLAALVDWARGTAGTSKTGGTIAVHLRTAA